MVRHQVRRSFAVCLCTLFLTKERKGHIGHFSKWKDGTRSKWRPPQRHGVQLDHGTERCPHPQLLLGLLTHPAAGDAEHHDTSKTALLIELIYLMFFGYSCWGHSLWEHYLRAQRHTPQENPTARSPNVSVTAKLAYKSQYHMYIPYNNYM